MKAKEFAVPEDLKRWCALSCPIEGLRFDARTLELLDGNHDGLIRSDEVQAALSFLKEKGVEVADLATPEEGLEAKLADVLARAADLAKLPPSAEEAAAQAAWEAAGQAKEVAVCGADTAQAEAALAKVEKLIDGFFVPSEDEPLVAEGPDRLLPLDHNLNVRHIAAIDAFRQLCVAPILGAEVRELTYRDWERVKAAFAPYRAWCAAKPVCNAAAKTALVEEERLLRYKLYLGEFLRNYVTMDRLYGGAGEAIFQTGILRIDGRELLLCFHVSNEAAHAALAEKSKCCVLYAKLTAADRTVCAVVTAGTVGGLYVGRNAVFYDRDGKNWAAVITKVVTSQVSLREAFWEPWRKIGAGFAEVVKKFLGDRQTKAVTDVTKGATSAQASGAAMASSVAAVGIGVGMVGAAWASVLAVVSSMTPLQLAISVVALILLVSLPSVILTWFKLRRRDLGAILNASGWAINRPLRFSMKLARGFTRLVR